MACTLMNDKKHNTSKVSAVNGTPLKLPAGSYEIIYANPPWPRESPSHPAKTAAANHLNADNHELTLDAMLDWRIAERCAAKDCLLFMWADAAHLKHAIELGKAWGFNWATVAFIWDTLQADSKSTHNHQLRPEFEFCLVFKYGKIPQPRGARNIRQLIQEKSNESNYVEKPDEVRKKITKMFPTQKKIELFASKSDQGWSAWQCDVPKYV